ncbi:MAG TPA: stomatin/prohibitin-family membrane protease subunit [Solibacterales bacterium]|nr:stomatin/prohibitin-family membrane protease subunit [Bryobacterales bacterium]
MLWKRIIVGDFERALVIRNGRFAGILKPGAHTLWTSPFASLAVEMHSVRDLALTSEWVDYLAKERPDVVARDFVLAETGDTEVAMVTVDGRLARVLGPAERALFWKDTARVEVETVNAATSPEAPRNKLAALERLGRGAKALFVQVDEGKLGVVALDNRELRTLGPGKYGFWLAAGNPRVEFVETRKQAIEITGQEILTLDKVSIRVNALAVYEIASAMEARLKVKDLEAHLYRTLQVAVRKTLGRKTLEEILADKTGVDASVAEAVREEMSGLGVRVGDLAVKDIILPGEMREILNRVVAAEKEAQANLIRRREETAATRSLLNTAKLMEDNPILVRLKELETLEKLVGKVDRVTVSGGFEGLLKDLLSGK